MKQGCQQKVIDRRSIRFIRTNTTTCMNQTYSSGAVSFFFSFFSFVAICGSGIGSELVLVIVGGFSFWFRVCSQPHQYTTEAILYFREAVRTATEPVTH